MCTATRLVEQYGTAAPHAAAAAAQMIAVRTTVIETWSIFTFTDLSTLMYNDATNEIRTSYDYSTPESEPGPSQGDLFTAAGL